MLGAALVNPAEAFGRLPAFYRKPGSTASVVTVQVGTEPWIKIVKKAQDIPRISGIHCLQGSDTEARSNREGANQGSMAGLGRRLARLDVGRV